MRGGQIGGAPWEGRSGAQLWQQSAHRRHLSGDPTNTRHGELAVACRAGSLLFLAGPQGGAAGAGVGAQTHCRLGQYLLPSLGKLQNGVCGGVGLSRAHQRARDQTQGPQSDWRNLRGEGLAALAGQPCSGVQQGDTQDLPGPRGAQRGPLVSLLPAGPFQTPSSPGWSPVE